MLEIDDIRQRLQDRRPKKVAEATGMNISTVMRVRDGKTIPTPLVQKTLSDYLEQRA